jgi:hypothetical protein
MSIPDPAYQVAVGLSVFTVDDEEIGYVERTLASPTDLSQHYLVVHSDALADMLGSDTLYVPDSDIRDIESDRVVLDVEAMELNRPDWTTPPQNTGD